MPSSSPVPDGGRQPDQSKIDEQFAALTADLEDNESYQPFRALFLQAQTRLQNEFPEGFDPTLIGRQAWSELLPEECEPALNALFYTYFSVQEFERDEQARFEWMCSQSLLDEVDETALQGEVNRQSGASVVVERARLARVLAELERLQLQVDALVRGHRLPEGGAA